MTKKAKNILVICGPTASGKTSIALKIAELLTNPSSRAKPRDHPPSVNILSSDSRQIYKGLDIVTGKDIPSDLPCNIKFFGIDLAEPDEIFNVSDFAKFSDKVIKTSLKEKVPLVIVGGTGLYLKAITSNLLNVNVPPNIEMREKLEKLSVSELQNILSSLDSKKLKNLNNSDRYNPRRLIRAIEIATFQKQSSAEAPSLSSSRMRGSTPSETPHFIWIGLNVDKQTQQENIRQRVIQRLENGAIQEVQNLLKKYPNKSLPINSSLGIKEISDYLEKKITYEELIQSWLKSEVDYARRQMVWFKKQSGIVWYDIGSISQEFLKKLAKNTKNE